MVSEAKIINHKGVYLREGTGDLKAFKDVDEYKSIEITSKDTCLDLGAHIGCWLVRYVLPAYPRRAIAVEPEPGNFRVLRMNLEHTNVVALNAAAAAVNGTADFYPSRTKDTRGGHFRPTRGRPQIQVKTISYRGLVNEFHPTIIKCDIEGAELNIGIERVPKYVRAIALEFHFPKEGEMERAIDIYEQIEAKGFTVEKPIDFNNLGPVNFMGNWIPRTWASTVFQR